MPKRISRSTVQNTRRVVLHNAALSAAPAHPSLISQVMAEMGRKGGRIGGKRRLETMTKRQRTEIAKKAAKARWSKKKPVV